MTAKKCARVGCNKPKAQRRRHYCSQDCAYLVYRRYSDSRCKRRPTKWHPEALQLLHDHYGMLSPKEIATRLERAFGMPYSAQGVYQKAHLLNLKASDASGLVCLADVAREVGISRTALWQYLKYNQIKTYGKSRYRYLSEKDYEAIKVRYAQPPEPTVSTAEAAELLKISIDRVRDYRRDGRVRGYLVGYRLRISLADVRRIAIAQERERLLGARSA